MKIQESLSKRFDEILNMKEGKLLERKKKKKWIHLERVNKKVAKKDRRPRGNCVRAINILCEKKCSGTGEKKNYIPQAKNEGK